MRHYRAGIRKVSVRQDTQRKAWCGQRACERDGETCAPEKRKAGSSCIGFCSLLQADKRGVIDDVVLHGSTHSRLVRIFGQAEHDVEREKLEVVAVGAAEIPG